MVAQEGGDVWGFALQFCEEQKVVLMWMCSADGEEVSHGGRVFGSAGEVKGEEA